MTNPIGRPPLFNSAEELEKKIDGYFSMCDADERPYTVSGLALALNTTRRSLLDYEEKEEFFHTIKKAKQKIEAYAEERLFSNNVAGVIFNMKNNWGWKDKTEVEQSGTMTIHNIEVEIVDPKD